MKAKKTAAAARKPVLIALSDYENALDSFPSEKDPGIDRSVPRQPLPAEPGLEFFQSENSPVEAAPMTQAAPGKRPTPARASGVGWIAWTGAACAAVLLSFWLGQLVIPSMMRRVGTAGNPQTQVARAPAPAPSVPSPDVAPPSAEPSTSTRPPATQPPPARRAPLTRAPATRTPAAPASPVVVSPPGKIKVPTTPAPRRSAAVPIRPSAAPASRPPATPVTPPARTATPPTPAVSAPAASSSAASSSTPSTSPAPSTSPLTAAPPLTPSPSTSPAPGPSATAAPAAAAPVAPRSPDTRTANLPPPAAAPVVTDEMSVSATLERYRAAYSQLNAASAKAVWPSVDLRTLSRAFDQLESQDIVFTGCRVQVAGDRANAVCNGNAAFVPKVGARTPRVAYREWNFDLRRVGDRWVISAVGVR